MTDKTVTISKAEYDRLRAVERAAQRVIVGAELRNDPEIGPMWLQHLNDLAVLVPTTRMFEHDPLR